MSNDVFTSDSHVPIDETTAGESFTQTATTGSTLQFSEASTSPAAAGPVSTTQGFTDLPTVWDDLNLGSVSGTSSVDDPLFDFTSPGTITSDVFTEAAVASAEITSDQTSLPSTTKHSTQESTGLIDLTTVIAGLETTSQDEQTSTDGDELLVTTGLLSNVTVADTLVTTDSFVTSEDNIVTTSDLITIALPLTTVLPTDLAVTENLVTSTWSGSTASSEEATTASEIATTEENEATTFTTEVFISNGTQPEELEPTTSAESLLTQTEPLTAAFTTHAQTTEISMTTALSDNFTTAGFANESVVDWTFVDNESWSTCSVSCGYGGVRTRTQVCNTDNCGVGSTRTVTESCNAASSCFAIVTNNVTMSFDLTVSFSTNATYNSSTDDNIDMITSGIRDALESIASYLGSYNIMINVQPLTARRRRTADLSNIEDYYIESEIYLEEKLEKDKIQSLRLLNVSDFLERFNLFLDENGYQVESESDPEVAVEESLKTDNSFDPSDGISCADVNAEPVGAQCLCRYGFKDYGVGCRRTQPLTLLRALDNVFFRIYHSHVLSESFKSSLIKRFSRAHMIARYQWKLTKMAEVHGPKSSSMKRCSQESVTLATSRYERELRLAVAEVDLLTIEIEDDLKASPSKFDSQNWLEENLCSYVGRIHESLIDFIHITSFKCRKAGFLWPKQKLDLGKKALKGTFHHKLKRFLQC